MMELQLLHVTNVRRSAASQNGHMSREMIGLFCSEVATLRAVSGLTTPPRERAMPPPLMAPPSSAAGGGVASEKLGQTHGGETDTTSLRMTQKYVTESV